MNDFEIGYIMGLVVGEGCFASDRNRYSLEINLHETDPEPLEYIQMRLGGRIYGVYEHNNHRFWRYLLRGIQLRKNILLFYKYRTFSD